jgi:DNA-binding response OmpR family regulator
VTQSAKPRVLVVDDSIDMQELVNIHLQQEQMETIRAANAEEALRAARELSPAAIVLDLDLGSASGLDVCRALKADPRTEPIPIIILTGTHESPMKLKAFLAGAVDYVIKPFYGGDLRTRVRTAIRLRRYAELLSEHAELDAETELRTRRALDRIGGAPILLTLADPTALIQSYGMPFYYAAMRALANAAQTAADAASCFLYAPGSVAVLTSDAAVIARLEATSLALTHGGKPVDLGVRVVRP